MGRTTHRITATHSVPANVEWAAVAMAIVREELFIGETLANVRDDVRPLHGQSHRPRNPNRVLRNIDRDVRAHADLSERQAATNAEKPDALAVGRAGRSAEGIESRRGH
jgi:hypothetical protein